MKYFAVYAFVLFSIAAIVDVPPACSTDRYVSLDGSDAGGNQCILPSSPCRTIQHAFGVVADGDIIKVAAGEYKENISITVSAHSTLVGGWDSTFSSKSSNPSLTIIGIDKQQVVLDISSQVAINNFTIRGRTFINPSSNSNFTSCIINNHVRSNGVSTISNSIVYGNLYATSDTHINSATMVGRIMLDCGTAHIVNSIVSEIFVTGKIVPLSYDCELNPDPFFCCVASCMGTAYTSFSDIESEASDIICFLVTTGGNFAYVMSESECTDSMGERNVCGTVGYISDDSMTIHSDPKFVNANGGNHHIMSDSPAVRSGICGKWTNGVYERIAPYDDFEGDPRPGYGETSGCDMGADQWVPSKASPWKLLLQQ